MAIGMRNPGDGLPGNIRQCSGCEFRIMCTELGWLHIDTHGVYPGPHAPWPEDIRMGQHKHHLKFKRTSAKGKRLIFTCLGCGKERSYIRHRVHMLLTNTKTKFVKKDRSN